MSEPTSDSGTLQRPLGALCRRLCEAGVEAAKLWRYGPGFPRRHEPLWVETAGIERAIAHPFELGMSRDAVLFRPLERTHATARAACGHVLEASRYAALRTVSLDDLVRIRCCLEHWGHGVPWGATGIYEHAVARDRGPAGPRAGAPLDAVRRRYARLDAIFLTVARDGRLRAQGDLGQRHDGIEVHVGPDGRLIFGGRGCHRLAMAIVLELDRIPAMLGFVHEDGLRHLARLRAPPPAPPAPRRR